MTVLDPPRHPHVDAALALARAWCAGRVIDDAPALRHAVLVARTLVRHVPDVAAELVATALVHDAEEFAPEGIDLDAILTDQIAAGVAPIVRALAAQHRAMDAGAPPVLADPAVALVAGADKIVAFRSLLRRANTSADPGSFWQRRPVLRALLGYFHDWCDLHAPLMPASMTAELRTILAEITDAMNPPTAAGGRPQPTWLDAAVRSATRPDFVGDRSPLSGSGDRG